MRLLPTLVFSLSISGVAHAVAPPETMGSQGAEPVRVLYAHPGVQAMLTATPAWRAFVATEGQGWEARFDELTGMPFRMWGPPLPVGPLTSSGAAAKAALSFAREHAELLGVTDAKLVVSHAAWVQSTQTWYVDLATEREGTEVYKGGLTFRFRNDRLVMAGAATYPDAPVLNAPRISTDQAIAAVRADGPGRGAAHEVSSVRTWLVPEVQAKRAVLRHVLEVRSSTGRTGDWSTLVDASTGEVVTWWNHVRFLEGELSVEHDDRLGAGDTIVSPLRNAQVLGGSETAISDDQGVWAHDGTEGATVRLRGPRLDLTDLAGTNEAAIEEGPYTLTSSLFGDAQAGLTTFVYVQQVQDFARSIAPEVRWTQAQANVTVNIEDTCNAYYDGTLNFMQGSGTCRNTGRLADVIFHEWGHGFHDSSIVAGTYDYSLGEGAADTMAFLLTDDSRIAPNFFVERGGTLRNTDNSNRYPDDFREGQEFIHENGLIFGGSMWSTREALRAELGEPAATQLTSSLFVKLLKGGPSLPGAYFEALIADDDDGDLSNGTPHQCALVQGFGKHGLGPIGGQGVTPRHEVPAALTPEASQLTWQTADPAPGCLDITPTGATLHWRVVGDDWRQVDADIDGDNILSSLPVDELIPGTVVEYWIEIETDDGTPLTEPSGGEIRPHTVHVGDVLEIWCTDFEENKAGFRSRLLSGVDEEGADDWTRGRPRGSAGDPDFAASGDNAWGNDLGGGRFDGAYQNDKYNQLRSPEIETYHYEDVSVRYQRWLSVEDGAFDEALIVADGTEVWRNHGTDEARGKEHHLDDRWENHVVNLGEATDDGLVQVTWDLISDPGLQFGGWNLDDVCLIVPNTPDNRLGVNAFTAVRDGEEGPVSLTWTMPRHDPVERLVIVRKQGEYPTAHDDGDVVYETTDIALTAVATATDEPSPGPDWYYAAFATDGTDWPTHIRPGVNAASVDGNGDGITAEGCGCAQRGGAAPAGWLGLWLLVGLRRRR